MAINYYKKKDNELKDKNTANPWQVSVYGLGFEKQEEVQVPLNTALVDGLSDEEIAKFLDGSADARLQMKVLKAAQVNPMLANLLCEAAEIDKEVERIMKEGNLKRLPLGALAASEDGSGSACGLRCEEFILNKRGIKFVADELVELAKKKHWLREGGTRIGDVGNTLETVGLTIDKSFDHSLEDLKKALDEGKDVIAIVDGGELIGDRKAEILEDIFIGEIPDHAVVVTHVDIKKDEIEVFDPQSHNEKDCYTTEQFLDAWEDSCRYAVIIS